MSFAISSSVKPTASIAAILAIGKPVALEASADDRDTRGFISMTMRRPVRGSTANWTLEPPVSTPITRRHAIASSRISWYSRSDRVITGATVTESPVWTPMGSTFSIEHTITALSARSRMTSSSNSFHPYTDSSISTSLIGDVAIPFDTIRSNWSASYAMPVPPPPRMYDGRIITGKPSSPSASRASSSERT